MERFTWNEEEHRQHFPKLAENDAIKKENEAEAKESAKKAREAIEEIKNQQTYAKD